MDTGATTDVISPYLCNHLASTPETSNRRINTATGGKSVRIYVFKEFLVSFHDVIPEIDFLVLRICQNDMIICRQTMPRLQGVLDCGNQTLSLEKDRHQAALPLAIEYVCHDRPVDGGTGSDGCTSDFDLASQKFLHHLET